MSISPQRTRRTGFTLVELLVVISIILVASSVIILSTGGGGGAALSSSQRIMSGIVQGARGQAILKNARTRIIIHNDPSDLEKYRRFVGIMYEGTDRNGNPGWIAATQGTYLPEGIYFDAATSASESPGASWSTGQTVSQDFPRNVAQAEDGGSTEYFYYEYNSNGTCADANAYIVLRAATMIPDADGVDELRVNPDQSGLYTAIIIRRVGNATQVNEQDAINPTPSNSIE